MIVEMPVAARLRLIAGSRRGLTQDRKIVRIEEMLMEKIVAQSEAHDGSH